MSIFASVLRSYVDELSNCEISIERILNYIERVRFDESRPEFYMCRIKPRGPDVYNHLSTKYGVPENKLSKIIRIENVCERMYPPPDLICFDDVRKWAISTGTSFDVYFKNQYSFIGFTSSLFTTFVLYELFVVGSIGRVEFNTTDYTIKEIHILVGKWKVNELNSICAFEEKENTPFLSFRIEDNQEDPDALYVFTSILELITECGKKMYIVPWIKLFLQNSTNGYIYDSDMIEQHFVLKEKITPERTNMYVPIIEDNLLTSWGILRSDMILNEPIKGPQLASNFMNSYVYCLDLDLTKVSPPDKHIFPRSICLDILHRVASGHVRHLIARSYHEHLKTSKTGVVSFIPGPGDYHMTIFVSTVFKHGSRYHVRHGFFLTNDSKKLEKIVRDHWCQETKWINENVFIDHLISISITDVLPVIPVGKIYFTDRHVPKTLSNKRWKLAGCSCVSCEQIRSTPFVF